VERRQSTSRNPAARGMNLKRATLVGRHATFTARSHVACRVFPWCLDSLFAEIERHRELLNQLFDAIAPQRAAIREHYGVVRNKVASLLVLLRCVPRPNNPPG
jgi:hypothetical protein